MKNTRRLIPVVALLLVTAVMLSTASYAWFTMNEEVTATGMQVQAKADGSLLISQAPFSESNLGTADVEISTGVKNLKPMAYKGEAAVKGTLTDTTLTNGWYVPADNKTSNIVTGANTGAFNAVTNTSGYDYKEEFYIATAGDAVSNTTLKVVLTAPTVPSGNTQTHKAYAAAIYVVADTAASAWADGADVTVVGENAVAPNVIAYVDTYSNRNTVEITGVNIPSIASAVGSTTVGLKVIVHFYVDGALQAENTVNVITGYTHVDATGAYNAETAYYTFTAAATQPTVGADVTGYYVPGTTANTYVPATGVAAADVTYYERAIPVATDEIKAADEVPTGWFVASEAHTVASNYCYVRSADIPSTGATLKLAFSNTAVSSTN